MYCIGVLYFTALILSSLYTVDYGLHDVNKILNNEFLLQNYLVVWKLEDSNFM